MIGVENYNDPKYNGKTSYLSLEILQKKING